MERKIAAHKLLGLPRNATRKDMESQCKALLGWLDPERVPPPLRSWARSQRALVEEIYRGLSRGGQEAGDTSGGWLQGVPGRVASVGGWLPSPSSLAARSLLLRYRAVALVIAGVALGLAIVGALYWSGVAPGTGGRSGTAPATGGQSEAADLADLQEALARTQSLQGDHASQAQIAELERIVAADPTDADALFELGETHMVAGHWQDAIFWFERLLEVDPENVHAQVDIGTASMNLGQYERAEEVFANLLTEHPEDAQVHYNMGYLMAFREDSPDPELAVEHWKEVLRLAPGTSLAESAQAHIEAMP